MRISDWSSDVCSSDLRSLGEHDARLPGDVRRQEQVFQRLAGFLGGLVVDQLGKLEVGAHIGPVGHRAVDMAEMALQRRQDRKSVVSGKSVSVRVDLGGRRLIKKKKNTII